MHPPLPPNEQARLLALGLYKILDTPPEQEFDDITLLASHVCGTPTATISLVDETRQWFKSKVGMTECETPRNIAFCAHGILQKEVFVINDARSDERFAANPMVTGNPRIRFYAGAPLLTTDGHALGMLSVQDQVPRKLSAEQMALLTALSRQVVTQLEMRRNVDELKQAVVRLKQAEVSLVENEEKFRQLADNVSELLWVASLDLKEIHYLSPAYAQIWGRSVESSYADPKQWGDAVLPEERQRVYATLLSLATGEPSVNLEFQITRPDGAVRSISSRGFQVRNAAGELIRIAGIASDITDRKRIEAKSFQSQKLETIGRLAGGVAHEFNSILTAIIGQSELLLRDLPATSQLTKSAIEISQAAGRAATLTRQLLAYGRKQIMQPTVLDLNQVVASMKGMFQHMLGSEVDIQINAAAKLNSVMVDAGQIEQVIMNMVINAGDAMPNGGKLMFETANVTFDQESLGFHPELKPGSYVLLAITDTGAGIDEHVKARIFEPFFSTKAVGQGVGLGLSTCYGIVKQIGGHINVYSEVGRGTTFKIYLPEAGMEATTPTPRLAAKDLPQGTETILLVEDDPALREMASTVLRRLGYTIWTAANGLEALNLKHQRNVGHIDLLFTDVVMPHMSGKELADRVRVLFPHTRILFTSAYTENAIAHQGMLDKGVALLQKPYTPSDLANKLREVLDEPGGPMPTTRQEILGFEKDT